MNALQGIEQARAHVTQGAIYQRRAMLTVQALEIRGMGNASAYHPDRHQGHDAGFWRTGQRGGHRAAAAWR